MQNVNRLPEGETDMGPTDNLERGARSAVAATAAILAFVWAAAAMWLATHETLAGLVVGLAAIVAAPIMAATFLISRLAVLTYRALGE